MIDSKSKILVIIPAYNEEESILGVVNDLNENAPFADYIVINDGSTDDTQSVLEANCILHINLIKTLALAERFKRVTSTPCRTVMTSPYSLTVTGSIAPNISTD